MYSMLTDTVTDLSWPDSDITYTESDGTVVSESLSLFHESCEGHHGSDVFPFGLMDADNDGFTIKTGIRGNSETGNILTNRELLQAFDPRLNTLPYVYDTFKWDHCTAEGYNFDDAWKETAKLTSKKRSAAFEEGVRRVPMYSSILQHRAEAKAKRNV